MQFFWIYKKPHHHHLACPSVSIVDAPLVDAILNVPVHASMLSWGLGTVVGGQIQRYEATSI